VTLKISNSIKLAVPVGIVALVLSSCAPGGETPASDLTDEQQAVVDAIQYDGDDREDFLYECAQEEGALVWYTSSSSVEESLAVAFEDAYPGISVEVFKETTALPQIVIEEEQAGRHQMDIFGDIHGNLDRDAEIFAPLNAQVTEGVRAELKSEYFVGTNGFIMGAAFNPDVIDPEDAPTSYEDLADPKWAGQIAAGLDTTTPFSFGVALEAHGEEIMQAFAANARVQEGVSSSGVKDLIIAGEFPIGWGVSSSYQKRNAIDEGAPFQWVPLDPMVATFTTYSISKNAPHPCSAALALDWLLNPEGGQALLQEEGGAAPFEGEPILSFEIPDTDPDDWNIVYGTDPALYEDSGFGSYREAAVDWNEQFRTMFLR
jgi:iron(III) transport system substrate-binding protein